MSFKVFFDLSVSVSKPIKVPKGTIIQVLERIALTEKSLGFETEQFGNNPKHWKSTKPKDGIPDETFCAVAEEHNRYVRWLYGNLAYWSEKPLEDGEVLTPEESAKFWYGLSTIEVPVTRWTRDYYVARMEAFYEAMRGREAEGILFEEEQLTPEQVSGVINIFASVIDTHDVRLDVPKGHDYLAAMDDGGYEWCEKCGAVTYEDAMNCTKENCPVKEDLGVDDKDD